MSRNMISYVKHLFETIVDDYPLSTIKEMRLKQSDDPVQYAKDLYEFQKVKLLNQDRLFHNILVAELAIDTNRYILFNFSMSALEDESIPNISSLGANIVNIHAGLFLMLVKELNLKIKKRISTGYLEQYIYYQQEDSNYDGHEIDDLKNCFDEMVLFQIESDSILDDQEYQNISYFICSYFQNIILLPFEDLVDYFRIMLCSNIPGLPKENIFLSLTSTHWKHAFLELYRCIEWVYSIPRAMLLKKKMNISLSAVEIVKHCRSELGWKRKEMDSIKKLFEQLPKTILNDSGLFYSNPFNVATYSLNTPDETKRSLEKIGEKIYDIRNQLVHQKEVQNSIILYDKDWKPIIAFLLYAINEIYSQYATEMT